jgi:hypothetical protein
MAEIAPNPPKSMQVTRSLVAVTPVALEDMLKPLAFLRADIWRRHGGLGTEGYSRSARSVSLLRSECAKRYGGLAMDGTIRAATTLDVLQKIMAARAGAEQKVRRGIHARAGSDKAEARRLYGLLRDGRWTADPSLHRQMRKHFRHGSSKAPHEFIVRSDRHSEAAIDGRLVITVQIAKRFGDDLAFVTNSSGACVDLTGKNLRVCVSGERTEIHYAMDRPEGRPCGKGKIGVDKGYTEALVDSDSVRHGTEFGTILRDYTDKVHRTGKARNKLYALEKGHRAAGRIGKADRIALNNLGTKKQVNRRRKTKAHLRTVAFKAVHAVVDKAAIVGSEDLTSPIARKKPWKGFNRRMGFWAKGVLAEALETITEHRHARHVLVNAAYTSQTDPQTRGLTGRREGDLFYCASGDVLQADHVGALNVLDRIDDTEITRFMPHDQVRRILLRRSPADCPPKGSSCGAAKRHQPTAEI